MDNSSTKGLYLLFVICLVPVYVLSSKLAPWALTVEPPPMIHDLFDPQCFNFTYGNYHEMAFYSPNYPDDYPMNADCAMYIQAPKGFTIDLHFMESFLVEESDGCTYDYIELRDGPFGYSKLIARFCGEGFPVSISTKTRFLWARFASDDVVQMKGFKAVYEFITPDEDEAGSTDDVCRIYMDNMAQDGELNTKVFPLADTSRRDYPIDQPVDCTWEMFVDREYRILLSDMNLRVTREGNCQNMIEIYDGTTSVRNKTAVYCGGPVRDYKSESNRVYLRIFGSRLSNKPVLFARYTVYRPADTENSAGPCSDREFHCDDMCLSQALVCNGHVNCPESGADEQGCAGSSTAGQSPIPMMTIIIVAAIAGLLVTGIIIGMCVTCRYKAKQRQKRKQGMSKQDSQKRNALEMAVSDSTNTAFQLAKQNNQNNSYYSLPRPSGHATMMQHRGSFSKVPSEGDYPDHMSDSNAYKKFLQLEQSCDDDSSRCPSPYSPGFTTIAEHHPLPPGMTMTPDLGWTYPAPGETNAPPTLAENLSKLQQYNQFVGCMPKTIPTTKDEPGSPGTPGMVMDFRYDPSVPVYPATKFRIKSPDIKYGWGTTSSQEQPTSPGGKSVTSLTFKNQDAETAPDLTREIGAT